MIIHHITTVKFNQSKSETIKYEWRLYTLGDGIPLETVYPWRRYTLGDGIPLEIVYPWRWYTLGDCIPLEMV